ncbi:hypothetical protein [Microbacterium sp.]|uniref:hypothetical protein n=1 Tax=Microbacterium sp. TaxID=51671 RepID=UPI002810BAAC|nr:hypothetical protein [Microbacterium sp.]
MSFFALAVLALGVASVVTDSDIISVPGLGPIPGVVGMLAAVSAFAAGLGGALRAPHPSFLAAPVIALATALIHLVLVWLSVLIATGDLVTATVVAGGLVQRGASLALFIAAAIAAWGGIALRRTRSARPRWPWEREEDE